MILVKDFRGVYIFCMTSAQIKKIVTGISVFSFLLLSPSLVFAASPDGLGPWADSVKSATQGLRKDGSVIPANRSDSSSTLGVAEDTTTDGSFYSLGFGGVISLGFDNGISTGVIVVEATNAGYPAEKVKVEVSENGTTWVSAGEVSQDGSVNKPAGVTCAKYVRITDISNKDDFTDPTADGYDVDGVKASGDACVPPTECKDGCCDTTVIQGNATVVKTNVVSSANTGGNKANGNSSDVTVKSGDAKSNVKVSVTGGTNVVNVKPAVTSKKTEIKISGNGANSKNIVVIGKTSKKNN